MALAPLLVESDVPLIVDQPEDSLDNKSIYEVRLLTAVRGRQDDRD